MSIKFINNSAKVKAELHDAILDWIVEGTGELQARTKKNSRPVTYNGHDVKNSWDRHIDNENLEGQIGSALEAAYWEEFGTGEYALNHDGRKGWWVYVTGNETPSKNQKKYKKDEAIKVMAMLRSKNLDAHITHGSKPNRPLHTAYTVLKNPIIKKAESIFKARFK